MCLVDAKWTGLFPLLLSPAFHSPACIFTITAKEKRKDKPKICVVLVSSFIKPWEGEVKDQSPDFLNVPWFCLAVGSFTCDRCDGVSLRANNAASGGTTQRSSFWSEQPWGREAQQVGIDGGGRDGGYAAQKACGTASDTAILAHVSHE